MMKEKNIQSQEKVYTLLPKRMMNLKMGLLWMQGIAIGAVIFLSATSMRMTNSVTTIFTQSDDTIFQALNLLDFLCILSSCIILGFSYSILSSSSIMTWRKTFSIIFIATIALRIFLAIFIFLLSDTQKLFTEKDISEKVLSKAFFLQKFQFYVLLMSPVFGFIAVKYTREIYDELSSGIPSHHHTPQIHYKKVF